MGIMGIFRTRRGIAGTVVDSRRNNVHMANWIKLWLSRAAAFNLANAHAIARKHSKSFRRWEKARMNA